jgi:hypothetical protein
VSGARAACTGLRQRGEMRAYDVQGLHERLAGTLN